MTEYEKKLDAITASINEQIASTIVFKMLMSHDEIIAESEKELDKSLAKLKVELEKLSDTLLYDGPYHRKRTIARVNASKKQGIDLLDFENLSVSQNNPDNVEVFAVPDEEEEEVKVE